MEKREYTKPAMQLFNIHHRERLLQTASQHQQNKIKLFDDDNDYIDNESGVM